MANAIDHGGLPGIVSDEVVPAKRPWGRVVNKGELLRLVDLEGQQAVDFLCYDAHDPGDRYSSMNTIKVQGSLYVGKGTVLYSDAGAALFTVIEDSLGRHDTVYGCCSEANNFLRYGVRGTPSCYANFLEILKAFGLDRSAIVSNVNFFMQVPIEAGGAAAIATEVSSSCTPSGTFSPSCPTARRCTTPATDTTRHRSG
jgi:hypothetical protein